MSLNVKPLVDREPEVEATERLVVTGGRPLRGKIRIGGAKNATLAILCACVLAGDEVVLENVPDISDVRVMLEIIGHLGVQSRWLGPDALWLKGRTSPHAEAPYELVKKLRASNLLLGPLLTRCGRVRIALPGGCNIGARPMDLHFKGLAAMGASLDIEHGCIVGAARRLTGARVYLDFPSVGATENIMMAAVLAQGQTIIENVAKEPEVVDLANFLSALGARIRGAGTDVIKVEGVGELGGTRYTVIPDRIEAGTFMVAAVATGGEVLLENVIPQHLEPLSAKLREAGAFVGEEEDGIRVTAAARLSPLTIKTMPYPGFPTDMQSPFMSLLTTVPGTSVIVENIFENRFQVAQELRRMGARIKVEGRVAIVEGGQRLQGTQVKATDLRAGAALVIAGLAAEGRTEIHNAHYVDRGYRDLDTRLVRLGAEVRRI
ncbi:MAG: UDP-N-acetylglucosamine 1-carboxyvinyltransferase [Desulfotomaculales bacterium]